MTSSASAGASHDYDTISFLSDYGHDDEFVGVVHSVIASIAPHVRVVDVTHGIAPCNVRAGGLSLARAAQYLMPGVVLAVVDPGVGTDRRPVAVEVGDGASVLVGPDNGLLAPAVALVGGASRAVELANPTSDSTPNLSWDRRSTAVTCSPPQPPISAAGCPSAPWGRPSTRPR